jgi:site-specific DNA recombinase
VKKKEHEEKKRVGIWIRVSTEDQARGERPAHHEARAKMYADSRGWTVVTTYDLSGVSGKSVIEHPEAKRMMADVRRGEITGLIFSKLARLARNTRELLDFAEYFRETGADLISLHEMIDTSTPAGRLFYTMIAAMATWEREEIAERVSASVVIRAKLGKPLGGAAPFGYRWVDRKLVPDPKEAPVLRLLFELFAEHGRKKTAARILNERGFRTRSGAKFGDTTVTRLLSDPTSKGQHRLNYAKSLGDRMRWKLKPESEWSYVTVEAVVPPELWGRVNARIAEDKSRRKPPARRSTTLFAGHIFCHCGAKMYVPSNTPKYVCFTCRNKIPVVDVEQVFHAQLREFLVSAEDISRHLEAADDALREKAELLSALEKERAKLESEDEKLYRLYIEGEIGADAYGRRHRPIEERLLQIGDETPRLQGEVDFLKIRNLSSSEVVSEARDLHARWPDLDFESKRRIVETITDRITIGKENIDLTFSYAPAPLEVMAKGHRNLRG